jgi:hypothetical protein
MLLSFGGRKEIAKAVPSMLIILVSAMLFVCVYGHLRCKLGFHDPLSPKLYIGDLDGWSMTHLLLFTIVGYMFPGRELGAIAFLCGVFWELVEHLLGKSRPSWLGGWGGCEAAEFEKENANWWFGRHSDIVVNGAGLLLGNSMRRGL